MIPECTCTVEIVELWEPYIDPAVSTKLEQCNLCRSAPALLEALEAIAKPSGPYSRDREIYLKNCLEETIQLAEAAIKQARGEE